MLVDNNQCYFSNLYYRSQQFIHKLEAIHPNKQKDKHILFKIKSQRCRCPTFIISSNIIISKMQVVDWISKQAGKIADNFNNYKFYIKHTPQRLDSSSILSLTPYNNREQQALVPCIYRWFRIKNGIMAQAEQFRGNSFICEPSDVGSIIQAEVTSNDQQNPGTAVLKFGPVQIDILLKQSVQTALSTGQGKFNVDLYHEDTTKQCVLTISDDFIRLSHCNSNANYKFYYSLGEPMFNNFPKDPHRITISFSQKFQTQTLRFLMELFENVTLSKEQNSNRELKLNIKFLNRKNKDEFLFVMKGFNAKKQLKNSTIISKIQKLQIDSSNINYLIEIESLRSDLLKLYAVNIKQKDQKLIYYEQTCKLEQQIQDIISSYTKLIEGKFKNKDQFESSFVDFENRKDQAITHKYQRIQQENNRLKDYIRQQIDGKEPQLNLIKSHELSLPNNNPFTKKKQPFAQIGMNSVNYEQVLANMTVEEDMLLENDRHADNYERDVLEKKLNRSLAKIEQLEDDIEKYQKMNRSAVMLGNEEINRSNYSNKGNVTAMQISAGKVIQQKVILQKKYARLKQEHLKLKSIMKNTNLSQQANKVHFSQITKNNQNPQFSQQANKQISRLSTIIAKLQIERDMWKGKVDLVSTELKRQKQDQERTKNKLQRRVNELGEQLVIARRNSDVLNRSQHLSMEMDDYNNQQNDILKEQNTFLMNENQRLTKMCDKYKGEYKRLKEINKTNTP